MFVSGVFMYHKFNLPLFVVFIEYAFYSMYHFSSNVQCTEDDLDITQCKSERLPHVENSCTHEQDVGLRCYEPHWAGVRLGVLAERCDLQYITIDRAGLLDYATNSFKPGTVVQIFKIAN